ncbi:MAG TPA: hypothetical protein VFM18_17450 [Methanosarcina sp.]|nr:hypothetical protein [Methanosarcina sp.]
MPIQKLFTSRVKNTNGSTFVGEQGRLFYDETDGALHLSDGVTPGGHLISIHTSSANIGNIDITAANISSTNTNQNIGLVPNGTGNVVTYGNLVSQSNLFINGLTGNIITTTSVKTSLMELDDSVHSMEQSGHDYFLAGPPYWSSSGSTFSIVAPGYGWIRGKRINFAPQSVTLAAHVCNLVYIDINGILRAIASPALIVNDQTYRDIIPLFLVLYDGTNIIVTREDHDYNFPTGMIEYIHVNVGTVVAGTGANPTIVTVGNGSVVTDREVGILGSDYIADSDMVTPIPDSGGTGVTWNVFNTNSLGQWVLNSTTAPLPMLYNNAGTPATITSGNYGIYSLYVAKENYNTTTPTYIAVMNTSQYGNLSLATGAITAGTIAVDTNELKNLQVAQLGYAVVQNNATGGIVANVIVSKSSFNSKLVGGGSATSAALITVDATAYTSGNLLNTGDTTVQSAFNTINLLTKANLSLGNVENTALSTWPGTTNIVTVGNVTASNVTTTGTIATGGIIANIKTVTTAYTIARTDYTILGNAFTGNFIIGLPTSPAIGTLYNIKKIDPSANIVSVNGGATTIDGAQFANIKAQNNSLQIQWNGSAWYVI